MSRAPEDGRDVERAFGRYRAVVDDFGAFADALHTPLPRVVWARPGRIDRSALARLFAEGGVASAPIAWDESALALTRQPGGASALTDRPGKHWGHWAGLFHVQEAASLVPVRVLAPRPGERVLDLCAAPGGKTARLALALEDRGTVVANDRSVERLAALSTTIARLGLRNVTCTSEDGTSYPLEAGLFDRVLVDAPCSAEGNARKNATWRPPDPAFRASIAGVQRALVRRAARLCRPGGRIVYSTCTFAPEENEAVIDAVVRELDGALRVLPIPPIAGLASSPGLTEWAGARWLPELAQALRLWPHVSGTGGFFVALLERTAGTAREPERAAGAAIGVDARESAMLDRFTRAFGLGDDAFDALRVLDEGRYARVVAADHAPPVGTRIVSTGLPIARRPISDAPKLSTAGALAFGRRATRRVVELDRAGAYAFQARAPLAMPREVASHVERGYVLARFDGHPLGCGVVRAGAGGLALESELPAAWSRTATGRG